MAHSEFGRELQLLFAQTTTAFALVTVGYYVLPTRVDGQVGYLRLLVSVLSLGLLMAVFRAQMRRSRRVLTPSYLRIQWLLIVLYLLILAFALLYSFIAELAPGQFVGIEDRTDALYFSVTIVATVGLGDIHPSGTVGQVATTAQMVFDLVYLGTALRLLSAHPPARRAGDA